MLQIFLFFEIFLVSVSKRFFRWYPKNIFPTHNECRVLMTTLRVTWHQTVCLSRHYVMISVIMTLIVRLRSCHNYFQSRWWWHTGSLNINNGQQRDNCTYSSCCWNTGSVGGPLNDFSPHLKMDWKLKMIRWPRGRGHNSHEEQTFQNPLKPGRPEILPIHVSLSKCCIGPIWKFWNVFSIATYFTSSRCFVTSVDKFWLRVK